MNDKSGDTGCYQLLMRLDRKCRLSIGALGDILFSPGYYIYTGRAKKGLRARVGRHFRREKKMRWHIDYFLAGAKILQVFYYFNRIDECIINAGAKENLRGSVFIKKFGSSDCCCPGHLIYVKGKPFYDKKAISG